MKIEKLEVGMVVKSYRELCDILEIKQKGGNSKKAQIKEIERYITYRKEGNKFIIQKINEHPNPKQDARKEGNNSKYVDDIEKLILDLLAQDSNKGTVELSVGRLLEVLNMVNNNYRRCRQDIPKLSEFLNVTQADVYDFYNTTQSKLKDNVQRALKKLRNRRLVYVTPFITVSVHNPEPKNELERFIHRPATKKEMESIVKAEKITMEEMGFPNVQIVCASGSYKEWKQNTNRKLYNWHKINYYYDCYRIANYKNGVLELLDEMERDSTKTNINKNVKQSTIDSAERKHKRDLKSKGFGIGRYPSCYPEYVDRAKIIADNIIDENAITIKFDIGEDK